MGSDKNTHMIIRNEKVKTRQNQNQDARKNNVKK